MTITKTSGSRTAIAGLFIIAGVGIAPTFAIADVTPAVVTYARIKDGPDFVVVVSHSGKTVHALSDRTGFSAKLTLEYEVVSPAQITIGKGLAVFVAGKYAYGFSNVTGQWSKVALEGKPNMEPLVGPNLACFVAGTKAYAFAAQSGEWAAVEIGATKAVPKLRDRIQIVVGSKVYLFTCFMKEWTVLDLADD